MVNGKILSEKQELDQEIKNLGYESLRYSLLCTEKENRVEWQWRLDYENDKYLLYFLADRAGIMGRKFEFDNFEEAKTEFINRLNYVIKVNKKRVENKEIPFYSSPLWDKPE